LDLWQAARISLYGLRVPNRRTYNYKTIIMPLLRANDSIFQILTLAVLVSGLVLEGCVGGPKYPDNWPSLTKTENKCAVLTGSYSDTGESATNKESGESVSLFRTLFPDSEIESTTVIDKISFVGPKNGVLKITAWNCRIPIETRYLKESKDQINLGLYLCYYDSSVLANCYVGGGMGVSPIVGGGGGHENRLYSGEDGSLVLKRVDVIIVVPLWVQLKHRWYRFQRACQNEDME